MTTRPTPSTSQTPGRREQFAPDHAPAGTDLCFSVIICTHNRRNMLLSALASLRRQTLPYPQFEVIVVDNGSTDGTFDAVETYVQADFHQPGRAADYWNVRCLVEPRNGLAYARNTGLHAASGSIAVFLDDDVVASPHLLEHLLAAYEQTGADAIGGRVEVRWEAPRPHWLSEDLLEMLGYFAPFRSRAQLPEPLSFSSCCFSVKMSVLQHIGSFTPFLGKRLDAPISMEVEDFCRRLRKAGYTLWYEPAAEVAHRAARTRLDQAFFIGRGYWQGRSEILARYADIDQDRGVPRHTLFRALRAILPELREFGQIALLHRPLLFLARRSTNERLLAAIAQSCCWGRICQQIQLLDHAPSANMPAVLLVRSDEQDATLLAQGLLAQRVPCTTGIAALPFSWLWQHRAFQGEPRGIVHLYRPGAFKLTYWQRQRFFFHLWLAQLLGLRIVTTDAGGWWQNVRSLRFLPRRAFERKLFACSDIVLSHTHQPEYLYPDRKFRQRVRCLPHPGLRGVCPEPRARAEACAQLGLPTYSGFVYFCFAYLHTERELIRLIEAFQEAKETLQRENEHGWTIQPQLLLIGLPADRKNALALLKRVANNPAIHTFLEYREEDIPLYMGATDALVMPYFALQAAGSLETALLFHSYERVVVAPDLPRFHGILPRHASVLYDPRSRSSLTEALISAPSHKFHLKKRELAALDARSGWRRYASNLLEIYQSLMRNLS